MNIISASAQHIGKRASQQDAFGYTDNDDSDFVSHSGFMAVVCDGMGGMTLGEEASKQAAHTMLNTYMAKTAEQDILETLEEALADANGAVLKLASQAKLLGDVGTTLVAAAVCKDQLYWISVGDSRIYLVRGCSAIQLNEDHSYGAKLDRMVEQGRMSRYEADHDPERHALISYLGNPDLHYISKSIQSMTVLSGDVVLLCSDGLYGTLTADELQNSLVNNPGNPSALVEAVLAKGLPHQDNATAVMLICDEVSNNTLIHVNQENRSINKKSNSQGRAQQLFKTLVLVTMIALILTVVGFLYTKLVTDPNSGIIPHFAQDVPSDKQ